MSTSTLSKSKIPTLTAATRCDRCGAQAYAAARFKRRRTALLFCAHHFSRWEARIRELAVEVVDERFMLADSVEAQKVSSHA